MFCSSMFMFTKLRTAKNQYPDGAHESKKRAIRKKAKRFVVKDGELYYIQGKTKHKVNIFKDL